MVMQVVLANPGTTDQFVPGPNVQVAAGGTKTLQLSEYDWNAYRHVIEGKIADGVMTGSRTYTVDVPVGPLAAGVDIGDGTAANARQVFAPSRRAQLVSVSMTPLGDSAGVDDSNTSAIKIYNGTSTCLTKTFDADPGFPAEGAETDLGTVSNEVVDAGTSVRFDVVNGTTAATPSMRLHFTITESL